MPQTEGSPYPQTRTDVRARSELFIDVCIFIRLTSVTKYLNCVPYLFTDKC